MSFKKKFPKKQSMLKKSQEINLLSFCTGSVPGINIMINITINIAIMSKIRPGNTGFLDTCAAI